MKNERRIDQIINSSTAAISSGVETIDSIVEKYPHYAIELRPRLEAVLWLSKARISCAIRPGFIIDSRKYLETKIGAMEPISFWKRITMRYPPQRWVFNIAAPVILVFLLALIINSLVLTSRLSIPGDPLYSTKLLLEDIQLTLTFNPVEKTDLYIHLSRERTTEFVDLVLEGDYEVLPAAAARLETEIIDSLHSINNLSSHDLAQKQPTTSEFRETLSNEVFILNILKGTSPTSAQPGIDLAIQVAESGLMALR